MRPADIDGTYPETKGWFARILHGRCSDVFTPCASSRSRCMIQFTEAGRAMSARGGNVLADVTLGLLRAMQETRMLEAPVVYTMLIPVGPWPVGATEPETTWIKQIGGMMRRNAQEFLVTLGPLLKTRGFRDELIDKFMGGARAGAFSCVKYFVYLTDLAPNNRTPRAFSEDVLKVGVWIRCQTPCRCNSSFISIASVDVE